MLDLATLLKSIPILGPLANTIPEVKSVVDAAITALHPGDQQHAKDALADIMADNKAGNDRLHDKLAAAAKR